MTADLRRRPQPSAAEPPAADLTLVPDASGSRITHPSGREKKSRLTQFVRGFGFFAYFLTCSIAYVSRPLHPALLPSGALLTPPALDAASTSPSSSALLSTG